MISYDVNVTTIVVFTFGVIAFYIGVLRTQDKQAQDRERIKEMETRLQDSIESQRMMVINFTAYKEKVAGEMREFVSSAASMEMEKRVSKHISDTEERITRSVENLGKRLDALADRWPTGR